MSSINNEQNIFQVSSPPPFNTMGLFTYLRTYARRHDETDPKSTVETWRECIQRVVESCNNQLHVNFTKEEMKEVFNLLYNLKCSVAGRFLWQLGTRTVDNLGLPSLQNCSFVTINEPVRPFTWAMNFLMLGSGVGYRVLPEDLKDFPNVKHVVVTRKDTKDADFIVPDSREGWIKLLGKVLKAHFYSGKSFTYSCTLLRSKGAPIKSFGGLASGPEVLCDGIEKINIVLNKRAGQSLRPIDALDVMNIIGMIVVSGNVRRSAQICLGDSKDAEYLNAKNWASGTIPNWRAFSNNSVICNDINEILENKQFWEGYNGTGEPYGLINLNLSKSCGRLGETQYNDPHVEGYNPCLTGDTLILTKDGMKRIDELVGKQFIAIVNGQEHSSTEQGFWKTGRRQVCKMTLKNGNTIRATLNHKFASCGYVAEDPLFYIWNELSDIELNEDVIVCDDHGYFGKSQIISITLDCEEDVYDCTINDVHCFSANGILSHNCAEQSLSNYETCCLGELYLPNITTKEELYKCATYIYRICKHSLTLPCKESEETERIVHKNMRMGIGVTGYLQATDEQRGWLSDCYKYLREFDKQYSIERGFPPSIKLSTCKPSGTLSLLGGCTSGVHPGFARYYKRRIRIASESPLIKVAKDHGYPVEFVKNFDGSLDHSTQIITFPYSLPENTVLAENCTAIQQLEWVKKLQTEWSDNSVSVTVYYRKNELGDIKEWLRNNYNNSIKSVSFLLHSDHGFQQAPLEQISKEEFLELDSKCRAITDLTGICFTDESDELINQGECVGGACPMR